MYAIILDRNKQYLVEKDSVIKADFMDVSVNDFIDINKILLLSDGDKFFFGDPFVNNKIVKLKVLNHVKDDKKITLKFRRRKHHMKRIGHRQNYTVLKVMFIGDE